MNREDVAMDVTVQNVEILRGRLEQAEELLSDALDWLPLGSVMRSNAEAFLASQQGEQATSAEIARVHPEQAEGAPVVGCLCGMPMTAGQHSPEGCSCIPALAQPSPKCATCDDNGRIGGPSFYAPDEGGDPCPDCVQPSPTSELERPEVVAFLMKPDTYEPYVGLSRDSSCSHSEPLMPVAQHDRIVGALRCKAELYDEVWELVTGKGYMNVTTAISKLEQERDAAQARVAELEKQEPVAWALQRKHDGFVRATWHQNPSETQYEIAELDGDVIAPLYAAPSVSTWKVPEGFALVPIEPTVAMRMPWKTMRGYSWYSKYKAMLAAAPAQGGE